MKMQDIKALTVEELKDKLEQEKKTLENQKFSHAITPLENPMVIRESRKLIARLYTELNAKLSQ